MLWDPALYSSFAQPRLRPALDLLTRIEKNDPARVCDLGCGTGNATRIIAGRWSRARVTGVDSSPDMLKAAAAEPSAITWLRSGIAEWRPEQPQDVIFSNAALHWLDDHQTLFPRLFGHLAPGGVLAVQMPHNHYAPSHRIMADTAESGPWAERLRPLTRPFPVQEPAQYHRILAPLTKRCDIWETEYLHVLDGDDPVVRWTMGTALRPLLAALDEIEQQDFLARYTENIARAYPRESDGRTLFAFRRIFIVAYKE